MEGVHVMIDILLFFVVYNFIWIVFLLIFFIILVCFIDKLNISGKEPHVVFNIFEIIFDFFDIIYNWHLTYLFLEFPKTYNETISARFRRYVQYRKIYHLYGKYKNKSLFKSKINSFRYEVSFFFAKILNFFQKGHI